MAFLIIMLPFPCCLTDDSGTGMPSFQQSWLRRARALSAVPPTAGPASVLMVASSAETELKPHVSAVTTSSAAPHSLLSGGILGHVLFATATGFRTGRSATGCSEDPARRTRPRTLRGS